MSQTPSYASSSERNVSSPNGRTIPADSGHRRSYEMEYGRHRVSGEHVSRDSVRSNRRRVSKSAVNSVPEGVTSLTGASTFGATYDGSTRSTARVPKPPSSMVNHDGRFAQDMSTMNSLRALKRNELEVFVVGLLSLTGNGELMQQAAMLAEGIKTGGRIFTVTMLTSELSRGNSQVLGAQLQRCWLNLLDSTAGHTQVVRTTAQMMYHPPPKTMATRDIMKNVMAEGEQLMEVAALSIVHGDDAASQQTTGGTLDNLALHKGKDANSNALQVQRLDEPNSPSIHKTLENTAAHISPTDAAKSKNGAHDLIEASADNFPSVSQHSLVEKFKEGLLLGSAGQLSEKKMTEMFQSINLALDKANVVNLDSLVNHVENLNHYDNRYLPPECLVLIRQQFPLNQNSARQVIHSIASIASSAACVSPDCNSEASASSSKQDGKPGQANSPRSIYPAYTIESKETDSAAFRASVKSVKKVLSLEMQRHEFDIPRSSSPPSIEHVLNPLMSALEESKSHFVSGFLEFLKSRTFDSIIDLPIPPAFEGASSSPWQTVLRILNYLADKLSELEISLNEELNNELKSKFRSDDAATLWNQADEHTRQFISSISDYILGTCDPAIHPNMLSTIKQSFQHGLLAIGIKDLTSLRQSLTAKKYWNILDLPDQVKFTVDQMVIEAGSVDSAVEFIASVLGVFTSSSVANDQPSSPMGDPSIDVNPTFGPCNVAEVSTTVDSITLPIQDRNTLPPVVRLPVLRGNEEGLGGDWRGIQGSFNSCYLDSLLIALLSFSNAFDRHLLLLEPTGVMASPEAVHFQQEIHVSPAKVEQSLITTCQLGVAERRELLKYCLTRLAAEPLRKRLYVPKQNTAAIRLLLSSFWDAVGQPGLQQMTEEQDPGDLWAVLESSLCITPLLQLSKNSRRAQSTSSIGSSSGSPTSDKRMESLLLVFDSENSSDASGARTSLQDMILNSLEGWHMSPDDADVSSGLIVQVPRDAGSRLFSSIHPSPVLNLPTSPDNVTLAPSKPAFLTVVLHDSPNQRLRVSAQLLTLTHDNSIRRQQILGEFISVPGAEKLSASLYAGNKGIGSGVIIISIIDDDGNSMMPWDPAVLLQPRQSDKLKSIHRGTPGPGSSSHRYLHMKNVCSQSSTVTRPWVVLCMSDSPPWHDQQACPPDVTLAKSSQVLHSRNISAGPLTSLNKNKLFQQTETILQDGLRVIVPSSIDRICGGIDHVVIAPESVSYASQTESSSWPASPGDDDCCVSIGATHSGADGSREFHLQDASFALRTFRCRVHAKFELGFQEMSKHENRTCYLIGDMCLLPRRETHILGEEIHRWGVNPPSQLDRLREVDSSMVYYPDWDQISFGHGTLVLRAVLAIKSSHYVCFVRDNCMEWWFFDSMAGSSSGHTFPRATKLPKFDDFLHNRIELSSLDPFVQEMAQRLCNDIYMAVYECA